MSSNRSSLLTRTRRVVIGGGVLLSAISIAALIAVRLNSNDSTLSAATLSDLQQIEVHTKDYAFDMPESIRTGLTQVTLVNDGKEPHHLWILKLEQGKKLPDLFESMKNMPHGFPKWAVNIGGPNAPAPGGRSIAIIDLEPGHYAVICVIPAPDGQPHVMKGMAKEFDVTGSRSPAPMPKVDIESTLTDYDFTFSKPLFHGRSTIRFTNRAGQVHEAFIAKLAPGKRAADLLNWMAKQEGPPPAIPMGGITGIESGRSITIIQDFTPGTYAFYCFVPDAKDGREHIAHGMMKEFTVEAR
jgi:hypothetical protein